MIKVGSMQSNDLLIEYSGDSNGFSLVNMITILDDRMIESFLATVFAELSVPMARLKVFFCGANMWVVRARCLALKEMIGS